MNHEKRKEFSGVAECCDSLTVSHLWLWKKFYIYVFKKKMLLMTANPPVLVIHIHIILYGGLPPLSTCLVTLSLTAGLVFCGCGDLVNASYHLVGTTWNFPFLLSSTAITKVCFFIRRRKETTLKRTTGKMLKSRFSNHTTYVKHY